MYACQLNTRKFVNFEYPAKNESALLEPGLVGLGGPLELQSTQICMPELTVDVNCEKIEGFLNDNTQDGIFLLR